MGDTSSSNASDSPTAKVLPAGLLDLGFITEDAAHEAGRASSPFSTPETEGDMIGRYRLMAPLGEGGFGCVWKVEQTEPLKRELALKLIKAGMGSREIIARFEAERQALALMDHPNIASVLDAGTTTDSRPYFAMELVKGEPITEYCDNHQLSIRERLELFIPVCQAVQHAHQKAILHRDLKPSNILVVTVDGKPVPKVIDFGIAKALGGGDAEGPVAATLLRTQMGMIVGTPRYMSPEQAGSMPDVDTRSDVYALGVILCELLTGQTPFPTQPADFVEALRWVREAEPVKPSTLVQQATPAVVMAAAHRHTDPARFARALRGDLDWITLKALEKDRTRRYETPTALARDISRYLEQKPISAVAPTWRYQLGKFARRQRATLIATVLITLALITGTAVSLWQASRAEKSRLESEAHYAQARDAVDKYLARVSEHPRLNSSDFTDLQRELLETALPFYEQMATQRSDDPKLQKDQAWALWRLAKLYQMTRQLEKAEKTYEKVIPLQKVVAADSSHDPTLQKDLAFQYDELAYVQRQRGKNEACLASHQQAIDTMAKLVARDPANLGHQLRFGIVRTNYALTLDELKRHHDSEREYLKAAAVLEPLARQHPSHVEHWRAIGECFGKQGGLYRRMGRLREAEAVLNQAVECQEQAVTMRPRDRTYRHHLGNALSMLGTVLYYQDRATEAEPHVRRAIELHQEMAAEFPSIPLHRTALTEAREVLIYTCIKLGKSKEADALQELQQAELSRLASEFPDEKKHKDNVVKIFALQAARAYERREWSIARDRYQRVADATGGYDAHLRLCQLALISKEPATAVKHGVEFMEKAPINWQNYEVAARQFRDALALIRADAKTAPPDREQAAAECTGHLIKSLQKAVSLGFTGIAFIDHDERAAPLREHPDYQTLLQQSYAAPPRSPVKFQFDYRHDNPGIRHWTREGLTWTETAPKGETGTFTVMGPATVDGVSGTQLEKNGPRRLTVFLPDLGTPEPMSLKLRKPDGSWGAFSILQQVQ
ncbi:serine/threonine protein kinase [Roseimicrobium gellanilyticum]|uniref:Serine/threonine protein kinase n=1 Tax=Roseimicrobium gellanilyticum TaxID=748857 RepID=A0A366HB82_9BACT|nr:serine/threonine-protein kinase [Roseimicrobium gellanilyticum]RBP39593.1 serine/threonine protein kinase [Roseimicrobium gellanilyticum]